MLSNIQSFSYLLQNALEQLEKMKLEYSKLEDQEKEWKKKEEEIKKKERVRILLWLAHLSLGDVAVILKV